MIGDFNGDDVGDIAVSDYGTAGSNSVVVFGSNDLPALIDVASLLPENGGDGSRGIILMNVGSESVGDAGDFNSDGLNDVILRGPGASGFGEAAVVFGDDTPPPTLDVSTLFPNFGGDGSRGVALVGYRPGEDDFIGSWVAGIGDLNGDGIDDVAVNGRERYDIYTDDLFVVYGRVSSPPAIHLFDLTPAGGGTGAEGIIVQSTNPQFAVVFRMAGAGDLNGDGHADLLVTNSFADLFRGRAYLIFGRGDADADGIGDFDDNCIEAANTDQRDTDNDGFGNVCDPDLNNDVIVNFVDLRFLRNAYFSTPIDANWNADADLNGDNAVGFSDMAIMRDTFFGMPGPSALHNSKP